MTILMDFSNKCPYSGRTYFQCYNDWLLSRHIVPLYFLVTNSDIVIARHINDDGAHRMLS